MEPRGHTVPVTGPSEMGKFIMILAPSQYLPVNPRYPGPPDPPPGDGLESKFGRASLELQVGGMPARPGVEGAQRADVP